MSKCGVIGLLTLEQWKTVFEREKGRFPKSDKELTNFIMHKRKRAIKGVSHA